MFGFGVFSLAEVAEAEVALRVEDVLGGPVSVVEVSPGRVFVVLDYQPAEFVLFGGGAHVFDLLLVLEFGSVHSEDGEPGVSVALMPCPQGWPRVLAVVSSVCPEIDHHHSSAIADLFDCRRFSVEPFLSVSQFVVGSVIERRVLLHSYAGDDLLCPIWGFGWSWSDCGGRCLCRSWCGISRCRRSGFDWHLRGRSRYLRRLFCRVAIASEHQCGDGNNWY